MNRKLKGKSLCFVALVLAISLLSSCAKDVSSNQIADTTTQEHTAQGSKPQTNIGTYNTMKITIGNTVLTATLEDNSSVTALKKLLAKKPLTINMSDYANMEKVGDIGSDLPRNDSQITTSAGDIILYQGKSLVIYYDNNSWNLTRIGRINGITQAELKKLLGSGDVTVTFSLN